MLHTTHRCGTLQPTRTRVRGLSLLSVVYGLLLFAAGHPTAFAADVAHERVALFLSGAECETQRRAIADILSNSPGVRSVDMTAVPDHALVDITVSVTTGETLADIVRTQLPATAACHVDVMKSCITAGPLEAHATH